MQHTRNKKHRAALCRMNDEDLMDRFQAGTREAFAVQIPDASGSPERSAAMSIQQEYIQKALNQLPEMFREVVVLRDIQDLTYVDIAAITGLPIGTVKSRINRGRGRMKRLLRDVYPFSPDRFARASSG